MAYGTKSDRDHDTNDESGTFEQRHEKREAINHITIGGHSAVVSAMARMQKVLCTGVGWGAWSRGKCGQRGLRAF